MRMQGIYLAAILTTGIAAAIFVPLIFGRRRCPECANEYDAPMFSVNFGTKRYERCPHCRHWHWTRAFSQT